MGSNIASVEGQQTRIHILPGKEIVICNLTDSRNGVQIVACIISCFSATSDKGGVIRHGFCKYTLSTPLALARPG